MIDTLLNSTVNPSFGRALAPIQEERDFLLSHSVYHACCSISPPGRVVAVLGAAHVPGVVKHFEAFQARGCSSDYCPVKSEIETLNQVNHAALYTLTGFLLFTASASWVSRLIFVKHL